MHVRMCIINPYVYDSTPSRIHERRIVRACTCSRAARIIHDAPSYALVRSLVSLSSSLSPAHSLSLSLSLSPPPCPPSPPPLSLFPPLALSPFSTPSQRAFFNPSRGTCSRAEPHTPIGWIFRLFPNNFYDQRTIDRIVRGKSLRYVRYPDSVILFYSCNHGWTTMI